MSRSHPQEQRPIVEALEPKLLYSADIAPAAFLPEAAAHVRQVELASNTAAVQNTPATELVFIDASVPDLQVLLDDIARQREQGRHIQAEVIGVDEDGIARITETLSQSHDLGAIHLIGHGEAGRMQLGNTVLNESALVQHAAEIAAWGQALNAQGDILLYGCDLASDASGRELVHDLAALTSADVAASDDLTGSLRLGGDWTLEVTDGVLNTSLAFSAQAQSEWADVLALPSSKGTAVFTDTSLTPVQQIAWDGQVMGTKSGTAVNNDWTVVASASSPIRDEAIVVGVDGSGNLTGQRWNGTQWVALPANTIATGSDTDRPNFAVGYEHISGDTMVVWGSGSVLKYMTFNGTTWSAAQTVAAYTDTAPQRLQMAAQPGGDGMALAITNDDGEDHVVLWDGSSWGNALMVDSSPLIALDAHATSITYESVSGRPMVVYGKFADPNAYYRVFSNGAWSAGAAVGSFSESALISRTALASDPNSNRIVLGLNSYNSNNNVYTGYTSFLVWDGASWGTRVMDTSSVSSTNYSATVSVGFESRSGEAIGVFSNGSSNVRYHTWNATTNPQWSSSLAGPAIGAAPGALRLYADPATNHLMLGAANKNGALYFADWTGSAWGSPTQAAANTGSTDTVAFTWVWQGNEGNANDLWLGSSSTTTWPGVTTVSNTEVLSLGGSNLQLGTNTQGSFSHLFNMGTFGVTGLDDIAWISRDVTLTAGLTLHRGDVLFTTNANATLTSNNSVTVTNSDVVVFHPDSEGQYDKGTFTKIIVSLSGNVLGLGTAPDVKGLAVVEEDFTMGDVILHAGDILFTGGNGVNGQKVYIYSPAGTGLVGGVLSGSVGTLINGPDINISSIISSLEVISRTTTVKNLTLPAGSLLMSFEGNTPVGDTPISVTAQDVVLVQPTMTSFAGGTTAGEASIVVSGSSLGITNGIYDTLALHRATPPTFTSAANVSINEGTTAVTTVTATDADAGATISYRISGGADANLFALDSTTGALRFLTAPDRENPRDANTNHQYEVTVAASNGDLESSQAMVITVLNVNEAPVIDSNGGGATASLSVVEGQTAVTTVHAADPENTTPTYSLVSGSGDNALFTINATTGVLTFLAAPSFQTPQDANADNVYSVLVRASDGSLTDTQTIDVRVLGYNVPPTNHIMANQSLSEDGSFSVSGMSVQDPDAGNSTIWVIISVSHGTLDVVTNASSGLSLWEMIGNGGSQVTMFGTVAKINATLGASGAVTYRPDANYNGTDTFVMFSNDYGNNGVAHTPSQTTDTDSATLTIIAVNDAPDFTSNSVHVPQGGTVRPTIVLVDPDHAPSNVTITASAITAGHFMNTVSGLTVNQFTYAQAQAGQIMFVHDGSATPPGYTLTAYDGTDYSAPSVAAGSINAAPVINSNGGGATAALTATEFNPVVTTIQAADPESAAVSYTITGGADAALFTIDSTTGQLRFASTPDIGTAPFQTHSLDYVVTVAASDGASQDTQTLTVHLNTYNRPPVNTLPASFSATEDTLLALNGLSVSDSDGLAGDTIVVRINVSHGTLNVDPTISGGVGSSGISYMGNAKQVILTGTISAINATLAANGALSYRPDDNYNGGDTLTMVSDDLGHNGLAYNPTQNTDTDTAALTITPVNDAPTWQSNTLHVPQGGSAAPSLSIDDIDSLPGSWVVNASNITAGHFLNTATGLSVTQFSMTELQAGQILFVQDGSTTVPAYTLTVSDGFDSSVTSGATVVLGRAPVITSDGGGATASVRATEFDTRVTTIQSNDPESDPVSYTITGGADAAFFAIDSTTGELRFATTPDIDTAPFLGHGADYVVTVRASDGASQDTQTLTVHLDAYNRPPINTLPGTASTPEDTALALTSLRVADNDALSTDLITVRLSVAHGTLSIDPAISGGLGSSGITLSSDGRQLRLTGTLNAINATLSAANALIYRPDADYHGTDTLTMSSDDQGMNGLAHSPTQNTDTDTSTLTITPVNDAPVITSNTLTVIQGGTAQPAITITDVDSLQGSWMISASGITAGQFIDTTSGLSVIQFSADQLEAGTIVFVHDGSLTPPGYTLTVSDGTADTTSTAVVGFQEYNQPPVNTLPPQASTLEDTAMALTGLRVSDADALTTDVITVTLQVLHGTLSIDPAVSGGLSSAGIVLSSDGRELSLTGTVQAINATLSAANALIYRPDADHNGSDTLTMSSDDHGNRGLAHSPTQNTDTDTATLTITPVNDAPVITSNTLTVIQGGTAQPALAITDVDNLQSSWMISASGITAGHFIDTTSGLSVIQFSADQLEAGTIVFVHDGSLTPPSYTLTVSDGSGTATSTTVVGFQVYNQAPVNSVPGAANTAEDTPVALTGLGLADADASSTDLFTVTLQVTHGIIHVDATVSGGLGGSGISYSSDHRQVTLSGTMAAINATLGDAQAVIYTPDADFNGSDALTMTSDDHGHNGLAHNPTQTSDTDTLALSIAPVDDATVIGQHTLTIQQGGSAAPQLVLTDVDTAPESLMISAQDIAGGHFRQTQTNATITDFSYADLLSGHVVFVQDGSGTAPSYQLSLDDGTHIAVLPTANVTFVLAEVLAPQTPIDTAIDTPAPEASEAPGTLIETPATPEPEAAPLDVVVEHDTTADALGAISEPPPIPLVGNGFALDTTLSNSVVKITFEPTPQRELESVASEFNFTPATSWNGFLQNKEAPEELRRNLEQLRDQLIGQEAAHSQVVASSIALTSGLSVGYVIWLVRGGALIGSMLSAMPMWQMIDPLPVLTRTSGKNNDVDGEDGDASVEQIFDGDHSAEQEPADQAACQEPTLASPETRE